MAGFFYDVAYACDARHAAGISAIREQCMCFIRVTFFDIARRHGGWRGGDGRIRVSGQPALPLWHGCLHGPTMGSILVTNVCDAADTALDLNLWFP